MEEEIKKQIGLLKKENKTLKKNLVFEIGKNQALEEENQALRATLQSLKEFIGGSV